MIGGAPETVVVLSTLFHGPVSKQATAYVLPADIAKVSRRPEGERGVGVMERSRPSRWRCPKAVVLFVLALWPASASGPTNTTEHADVPLLDWSKWDEPPPNPGRGRTEPTVGTPTMRFVDSSCLPGACQQQQLRRLVHECSRQLKLPGLGCGDSFVTDDDYRVPLFESLPSCGFEVRCSSKVSVTLMARLSTEGVESTLLFFPDFHFQRSFRL